MLDSSNNLTLEEIDFDQEDPSILITDIKYDEEYQYLNDVSFKGDYLTLSHFRIEPPLQKYQAQFYQNMLSSSKAELNSQNHCDSVLPQKRIAAITLKQKNVQKYSIRLPVNSNLLLMKVGNAQDRALYGQIEKKQGESQIALFDEKGNQKGSFNYTLKTFQAQSQHQKVLIHNNTLHQNQFLPSMSAVRKEVFPHQPQQKQKMKLDIKGDILNHQNIRKSIKNVHNRSQDNHEESDSEKSQIDYLGYHNSARLPGQYRLPIQEQKPKEQSKLFNYHSIKRSLNDLGLTDHHHIEYMLQDRREKHPFDSNHAATGAIQQDSPINQSSYPSKVKFQDESSQASFIRPQVVQFGIGTYSPLLRLNQDNKSRMSQFSRPSPSSQSIKSNRGSFQRSKATHLPRTHLLQPKLEDSSYELQSSKEQNYQNSSKEKQNQLSMRQRIYEIKVGAEKSQSIADSAESRRPDWKSCKQSSSRRVYPSDSQSESLLYPEIDICVNNISVNFHRRTFGSKTLQLSVGNKVYQTEALVGNNLIWVGKEYMFKAVTGNNELYVALKQEDKQGEEEIIAQVKIDVSDLILNKKKSYFQTFLLSKRQVVAILIVGFQILRKTYAIIKRAHPLKATRQTHAHSEVTRSKTTKIKHNSPKNRKNDHNYEGDLNLPQARANPIRVRKYIGGKNIKIGRASRFITDHLNAPGPGDYFIQSEFSRHALKDL